jgi:hypothetical protein
MAGMGDLLMVRLLDIKIFKTTRIISCEGSIKSLTLWQNQKVA